MKSGAIRYIKFSGYYYKFDEWKDKTTTLARHKTILKYFTKEWEINNEEDVEDDPYKLKIYEGNSKAWDFLIIRLYIYIF